MISFLLILTPIFLVTIGQLSLKAAVNTNALPFAWESFFTVLTHPELLLSILALIIGGFFWVAAMARFELSFIYPFMSINYLTIMLGSQYILNEQVSLSRYIAVIFIVIGLIIISRSPNIKAKDKKND